MDRHLTARAALRTPGVQDAALAALLLTGTWATAAAAGIPSTVPWWALTLVGVAAVAVRRRWPVPALLAASLATLGHMAHPAAPSLADLAVPIVLFTVAAERRRALSLALLGASLVAVLGWSAFVASDGEVDGWILQGAPFGVGGDDAPRDATSGAPDGLHHEAATGPTDWGGVPVAGSLLAVAWAIGWGVQSRRAYVGELQERERHLELEREQRAALAVAAERSRLTREVHDIVAHGLAVIVMQAQGGIAAFAERPADTRAALDTIVATGRTSLTDLRHVLAASGENDGPARPTAGLDRLPRLVDEVRQAGTPVDLRIEGSPRPLSSGVAVSAYRIVQEALTNTMKHAGPGAAAHVTISYGDGLTIEVRDDGVAASGAGAHRGQDSPGNGLRGMRERVTLLGGELLAGPVPDAGYVVRATVPLTRDTA